MTKSSVNEELTRSRLLALLSDGEIATVSNAEGGLPLAAGEEYVDLDRPELGVLTATSIAHNATATLLPRKAVSAHTWSKIVAALSGG